MQSNPTLDALTSRRRSENDPDRSHRCTVAFWTGHRRIFAWSLTLALVVLSPLASANPDGLEWVAEQAGFLDRAQSPSYEIIPDYVLPGLSNEATATIAAGVIGALIVLGVTLVLGYTRRRTSAREH